MAFSYSRIRRAVEAVSQDSRILRDPKSGTFFVFQNGSHHISSSFWNQIFLSLWGNEQTTITIFLNKMSHFFFLSPVWICKLLKLANEEKIKPVIPQATKQGSKRKRDEQDQQEEMEEEEEEEVATTDAWRVAPRKSDEEAEKEQHDK